MLRATYDSGSELCCCTASQDLVDFSARPHESTQRPLPPNNVSHAKEEIAHQISKWMPKLQKTARKGASDQIPRCMYARLIHDTSSATSKDPRVRIAQRERRETAAATRILSTQARLSRGGPSDLSRPREGRSVSQASRTCREGCRAPLHARFRRQASRTGSSSSS